jgi:hypothetical protein
MIKVVEHLPRKFKALSSNNSTAKIKEMNLIRRINTKTKIDGKRVK